MFKVGDRVIYYKRVYVVASEPRLNGTVRIVIETSGKVGNSIVENVPIKHLVLVTSLMSELL